MNAQGGAMLNDDELNRDWLDWLYTVSRVSVLLSIVYFYSSFGRFIMVLGAMLLVYLWAFCHSNNMIQVSACVDFQDQKLNMGFSSRHQAGWFPFRPVLQNLRGGEQARAPQEEAERHQAIQEMVSYYSGHYSLLMSLIVVTSVCCVFMSTACRNALEFYYAISHCRISWCSSRNKFSQLPRVPHPAV